MIKHQLKENDVVNGQFVILEKFDSKKHSSKIYKGTCHFKHTPQADLIFRLGQDP